MAQIQLMGRAGLGFCQKIGQSGIFLVRVVFQIPKWRQAWPLLVEQLYRVGVLSLVIVLLSAIFIGVSILFIFSKQAFPKEDEIVVQKF